MANYVEKSAYCPTCREQRLVHRKGVSAGMGFFHTVLSVITLGAWALVWRSHADVRQAVGYRCATCGTKIKELTDAPPLSQQLEAGKVEPMNFDAVVKRDIGRVERLSNRSSIKAAPGHLNGKEEVWAAAAGQSGMNNFLWLVTDRRVLRLKGTEMEEHRAVRSATAKVGSMYGTVTLEGEGGPIEVKGITPPKQAEAFAAAVGSREIEAATAIPAVPTEKDCPRCAETVKAAAKVCRFCGHEFE